MRHHNFPRNKTLYKYIYTHLVFNIFNKFTIKKKYRNTKKYYPCMEYIYWKISNLYIYIYIYIYIYT